MAEFRDCDQDPRPDVSIEKLPVHGEALCDWLKSFAEKARSRKFMAVGAKDDPHIELITRAIIKVIRFGNRSIVIGEVTRHSCDNPFDVRAFDDKYKFIHV